MLALNNKYLVLLSGGQDSVTCLLDLLTKTSKDNICAISFIYDFQIKQCVERAKKICNDFQIEHKIFDLSVLSNLSNNNIVSARNLFFLSSATLYAKNNGFNKIIIGLSKDDYDCYNDCKKKFVIDADNLLKYSFEVDIDIEAPLIDKTKKEIWEIADKLGKLDYVYQNTYSCWKNKEKECGDCLSCKVKERSYEEYIKSKNNKV